MKILTIIGALLALLSPAVAGAKTDGAGQAPPAGYFQMGPPKPEVLSLAPKRTRALMYKACMGVEFYVSAPGGIVVGKNGECQDWAVDKMSCALDGVEGLRWQRARCRGRVIWMTTAWTVKGPCFKTAVDMYGPLAAHDGIIIHADRIVYTWVDGTTNTVKTRMLPWICVDRYARR